MVMRGVAVVFVELVLELVLVFVELELVAEQ